MRPAFVFCVGFFGVSWAVRAASVYDDNFDDNTIGPQWTKVVDMPSQLDINEQNGRLEATANNSLLVQNDAIYLSDGPAGFRLSTASNFELAIDYSFSGTGGTSSLVSLVFGVGRDLDGTDSAAIGYVMNNSGLSISSLVVALRVADVQSNQVVQLPTSNTGTLVLSYNAATDVLTLGRDAGACATLSGLVLGQWNASLLYVSLGIRGKAQSITAGQATLDNFVIRSGQAVAIPEPVAMLVGLVTAVLLLKRR